MEPKKSKTPSLSPPLNQETVPKHSSETGKQRSSFYNIQWLLTQLILTLKPSPRKPKTKSRAPQQESAYLSMVQRIFNSTHPDPKKGREAQHTEVRGREGGREGGRERGFPLLEGCGNREESGKRMFRKLFERTKHRRRTKCAKSNKIGKLFSSRAHRAKKGCYCN